MAGRDYRSFVLKSRSNPEGLKARLRSEPAENLISVNNEKDYIAFETFKEKLKERSVTDLTYLEKIKSDQIENRESRVISQHQATWAVEWSNLQIEEEKLLYELMQLPLSWHKTDLIDEMADIMELEEEINATYEEFYQELIVPLITLRWDFQFWYNAYLTNRDHGQGDPKTIHTLLNAVRKQRRQVIMNLDLEMEQKSCIDVPKEALMEPIEEYQGVPSCVNFASCPKKLQKSLIDEFIILDIKYQQKLSMVKDRYHAFVRTYNGGWTDKEHNIFKYVVKLYPAHLINYQELCYDLLFKLLPHFTLDDFVIHQSWIKHRRQYKDSIAAVLSDWKRCKNDLAIKAQTIVYRVHRVMKETTEKKLARQKQKDLCYDLYIKVVQWRQWKLQRLSMEEEQEKKKFLEERQKEKIQEQERRAAIKQKLEQYRLEQASTRKELQLRMKLEALQARKAKMQQTVQNIQRIRYREVQRIQQLEMRKVYEMKRVMSETLREERLDKIRSQVSVKSSPDPVRVLKNTLSFDAKRKKEYEDDPIPILKPLFDVYSFTNDQADTRMRLEAKLREANLVHLPYAQEILQKLPPPTKPRRDAKSSIKFGPD